MIFPWSAHSEIKHNLLSLIVAPRSGRIFGCWRCFHATASLQNLCTSLCQHRSQRKGAADTSYPDMVIDPLWNVETQDLNGNLSTLELALMH